MGSRTDENYLEFRPHSRKELFPFMQKAFKQSLEPSLVCDLAEVVGEDPDYQRLMQQTVQNQKRLDLGIYLHDTQVGSFMGRHSEKGVFRMGTSVILPEYQGRKIYSRLLDHVVEWAKKEGIWALESYHNPCNSRIIGIKLKKGFYISGTETNLQIGNVVKMVKFLRPEHEQMFKFRNGFARPNELARRLLDL